MTAAIAAAEGTTTAFNGEILHMQSCPTSRQRRGEADLAARLRCREAPVEQRPPALRVASRGGEHAAAGVTGEALWPLQGRRAVPACLDFDGEQVGQLSNLPRCQAVSCLHKGDAAGDDVGHRDATGDPPQQGHGYGVDEEVSPGHETWDLTVDVRPGLSRIGIPCRVIDCMSVGEGRGPKRDMRDIRRAVHTLGAASRCRAANGGAAGCHGVRVLRPGRARCVDASHARERVAFAAECSLLLRLLHALRVWHPPVLRVRNAVAEHPAHRGVRRH
mmetsp:Transcript_3682/g.9513  ORF Transcript_3682/g.9513 Transcript_3682/m.9513 type:complete len:275 (+) Transcript_3682:716-1540(+)